MAYYAKRDESECENMKSYFFRQKHLLVRIAKRMRLDTPARSALKSLHKVKRILSTPRSAEEVIRRINRHCDAQWKSCVCEDPITVVVHEDMPSLEATVQSLFEQTHKAWRLCVLGLDKKVLCKRHDGDGWGNLPFSPDVLGCFKTPVLYITQPVQLLPEALHHFCRALRENADAAYADTYMNQKSGVMGAGPILKPDYAPDYLRGTNYVGGVMAFSAKGAAQLRLLEFETGFSRGYDAALQADAPRHIRLILHRELGLASDSCSQEEGGRALEAHLKRKGWNGEVLDGDHPGTFRVRQHVKGQPMVSIIIPNKDHIGELTRCVESIKRSTHPHYEVIVVENNSTDPATFAYYETLVKDQRFRVLTFNGDGAFNFSKLNNFGVQQARGDYLVLMNNDVDVISLDWMEVMLGFVQREDVGLVGAKLLYPNHTIQHGGIILLNDDKATHAHWHFDGKSTGYAGRLCTDQNYHAVTGACMMARRIVYDEVGGFTEELSVDYTDVDLCMKIRNRGYWVVWAADAVLYHYESITRGLNDTPKKIERAIAERAYFQKHWHAYYEQGDPYYSTAFTQGIETFAINWKEL